jgi:large conductance mechanosensitive channel
VSGFKAFLLRGNLVDLAVGVVIGIAFGTVITALVKDLITPLIAALVGQPDFSSLYFTVNHSRFLFGDFLDAVIAFAIVAAVLYFFVVMPYARFRSRFEEPVVEKMTCPRCLSSIPVGARRCAFCSTDLDTNIARS